MRRSADEREHDRKGRWNWGLSEVLTFGAVVGAIGTVILSDFGLNEARRATEEARRAANEAQRQADAAETQIAVAKRNASRQLRAYVSVKPLTGVTNFGLSEIAHLKVSMVNTGQTPATDLKITAILFPRPYPLPVDMDLTIPTGPDDGTGGSVITLHPSDTAFGITLDREIEPLQYSAIKLGIGRLYTFGVIYYKDIFGVAHWTHFCYNFSGDGPTLTEWSGCPRYNDTDKNE